MYCEAWWRTGRTRLFHSSARGGAALKPGTSPCCLALTLLSSSGSKIRANRWRRSSGSSAPLLKIAFLRNRSRPTTRQKRADE